MFVPEVDTLLVVHLPGEITRATVRRVVNDNTVLAELTGMPMAKSHNYRLGDLVAARRVRGTFGGEHWQSVETRAVPIIEEKPDAAGAGVEPKDDKPEHPKRDRRRKAAKAGGGDRAVERKATPKPKAKRRSGA